MAKARMLSRAVAIDKELNELSIKFEYIYLRCTPFLDDYGLLTNDVDRIKYEVFPRRNDITEEDLIEAFKGMKKTRDKDGKSLVEELPDCFYFKGFEKHNKLTEIKKAKSEFKNNRYNQQKSSKSPGIPEVPQNPQGKADEDRIREDRLGKGKVGKTVIYITLEQQIEPFKSQYAPSLLKEFADYWDELDAKGVPRWRKEKTWEIKRRLDRWARQQEKWAYEKTAKQQLKKVNETPMYRGYTPAVREDRGLEGLGEILGD